MNPSGCDVAIIGAGASGLAAAWLLASRGLSVVVLEQGQRLDQRAASSLVTLDASRTDSDGLPAAALTYRLGGNTRRMLDHGIARAGEALREAGAVSLSVNPLAAAAGFHFLGTARMGAYPATSIVDADCRSHDLADLMVIDGGVFVTAGGVNLTSTIQAIARRVADALATRLGAGASGGVRARGLRRLSRRLHRARGAAGAGAADRL